MMRRVLVAAAVLITAAYPAAAQEKGPALTFQTLPMGRLLDDIKGMAHAFGGDQAKAEVEKHLKEALGEKGFTGVDMLRPIVGYSELTDKAEASGAVVVVPITDEKEFRDFLTRTIKVEIEEVAGAKGLYKLTPKADATDVKNPPERLRFKDRHAYLAVNVPEESFTEARLIAPTELVIPNETAAFVYRLHIARIPAGLKKQGYDALDEAVKQLKGAPGAGPAEAAAQVASEAFAKLLKRLGDQVLTDGDTAFFRIRFDPQTAEASLEAALKAKPDSALSQYIAARKPTTNRFAGLITKEAAAGMVFQAPLFAPEVREITAGGLEMLRKQTLQDAPEQYKTLIEEAFAGAIRTIRSGELDLAAALTGPNKDGKFTASLAISFDDPSKLETALKDAYKTAPPQVQDLIKLDHAKANGVNIHRINAGAFLPPEAQAVFGDQAAFCLAFAPKGVYLTFGPDAEETITAALKAEPGAAKALDLVVNPARLHKVVTALNEESGKRFADYLGTEDKRISALSAAIEGGEELRMRFTLNIKLLPRAAGTTAVVPR